MEFSDIWTIKTARFLCNNCAGIGYDAVNKEQCKKCFGTGKLVAPCADCGEPLGANYLDAILPTSEEFKRYVDDIAEVAKENSQTLTFDEHGRPKELGLCWNCADERDAAYQEELREGMMEAEAYEDVFGDSHDDEYMRTPYDRPQHSDWVN